MEQLQSQISHLVDLAQPRLGAEVLYATDDFFADKSRMIQPENPVFIEGKYDTNGKWMDGWESRRRRGGGHDHAIVKICRGRIDVVDLDTRHFTGNYAPAASIEAGRTENEPDGTTEWEEILSPVSLQGNSHNLFKISSNEHWTHLRLNIYPDGGIARFRVYGEVSWPFPARTDDQLIDLAAMANGGRAISCSDMHFGHMSNLLAPGNGVNMGDGWETRRRRKPGFDWVIIRLARPGRIKKIEIDTAFFKGNFPYEASVCADYYTGGSEDTLDSQCLYWNKVLPESRLQADYKHVFCDELQDVGPVSHVRLNIFPDGGVSRLRIWGHSIDEDLDGTPPS